MEEPSKKQERNKEDWMTCMTGSRKTLNFDHNFDHMFFFRPCLAQTTTAGNISEFEGWDGVSTRY